MTHRCHAHGCTRPVPPKMLACKPHWFALPKNIRDAIWREYRTGQEVDRQVSYRYYAVQRFAVSKLAFKENDEACIPIVSYYAEQAQMWRNKAIDAGLGDPLAGLVS